MRARFGDNLFCLSFLADFYHYVRQGALELHHAIFETIPGFAWISFEAYCSAQFICSYSRWIFAWYFVWMHIIQSLIEIRKIILSKFINYQSLMHNHNNKKIIQCGG